MIDNVPRLVPGWTDPIVVGRHAFGDQYRATDTLIPGAGKLRLVFEGDDGKTIDLDVYEFNHLVLQWQCTILMKVYAISLALV